MNCQNIVECYKVECCLDKVKRFFDIIAVFDNNVEAAGNKVASCFDNVAGVDRA